MAYPCGAMSSTLRATTSQPRSLLSMARLNIARSRLRSAIWSLVRIDQTCFGRSGGLAPVTLPLFQGMRLRWWLDSLPWSFSWLVKTTSMASIQGPSLANDTSPHHHQMPHYERNTYYGILAAQPAWVIPDVQYAPRRLV